MMFAPRYTVWHCGYLKKGKREMSNTPRTDEAKWETAPAAIVVSIYFAQTLERENVVLRDELKDCSAVVDRQFGNVEGGVMLDGWISGFRCWNIQDLELVENPQNKDCIPAE